MLLDSGAVRPDAAVVPARPGVAKPVLGVFWLALPKLPVVDRSGATLLRPLENDFVGLEVELEKLPFVFRFGATAERLPASGVPGAVGFVLVSAGFDPRGAMDDGVAGFAGGRPGLAGVAKLGRAGVGVKLGFGAVTVGAGGGV